MRRGASVVWPLLQGSSIIRLQKLPSLELAPKICDRVVRVCYREGEEDVVAVVLRLYSCGINQEYDNLSKISSHFFLPPEEINESNYMGKAAMSGMNAENSFEQCVWSRLAKMENHVSQVADGVEEVRRCLMAFKEDVVKSVVSELKNPHKPDNTVNDPMRKTWPKTNRKSKVQRVQPKVSKGARKTDGKKEVKKQPQCITVSSDCSISPPSTKADQNNGLEKRKRGSIPAPIKLRRALWGNDRDVKAGPFHVNGKFSQEDINLLEFIFMERPSEDIYSSMIVARADVPKVSKHELQCVSRTDLQCLGPQELVGGLVINFFMLYLNEARNVNWYLSTHFGFLSTVTKNENKSDEEWIDHVKDASSLLQFEDRAASCEKIFIPLLERVGDDDVGHWFLVVLHVKKRYAKLLDSAPTRTLARQEAARKAMAMLDSMFFNDMDSPPMLKNFMFKEPEDTSPLQPPCSNDCGVFVIRHMQNYCSNWAANYNSHVERARLVIDCLTHSKNEVRGVTASANRALLEWRKNVDDQKSVMGKKHYGIALVEISDDSSIGKR